jgi:hypothetical protein
MQSLQRIDLSLGKWNGTQFPQWMESGKKLDPIVSVHNFKKLIRLVDDAFLSAAWLNIHR